MGVEAASREPKALKLKGAGCAEMLSFVIRPGENRVGAHGDNEIVVPYQGVSRFHAVLNLREGECELRDLASKNGTTVNGLKVSEIALHCGDVVTFGPAPFVVERIASSDANVAIAVPPGLVDQTASRRRFSGATTSSAGQSSVPERWLGVVGRVGEMVLCGPEPNLADGLSAIHSALGALAAALIEWDPRGDVVVTHVVGDFVLPGDFDRVRRFLDAMWEGHRNSTSLRSLLFDEAPLLALAASLTPGGSCRALVCTGDFPDRRVSGSLLKPALRIFVQRLPGAGVLGGPRVRRTGPDLEFPLGHVVGRSNAMQSVYQQTRQLLHGDIPVLITGETGVGKEHIARILHGSSARRTGPFQAVNCAAIPTDLLEAELFGIESGVATGVTKRDGKMQLASGGVVFLDEIGDMSPALQAKLLRALQEKEVHPVGARRPVKLDVWVIAATNSRLQERIAEGKFRADLYFRIAGYSLHVPALRERRADIPLLVEYFMGRFASEAGKPIRGISLRALRGLSQAAWPGNVRELEHQVRRLVYLCPPGQAIAAGLLPPELATDDAGDHDVGTRGGGDLALGRRVSELERTVIREALAAAGGNLSATAKLLGVSRYGLRLKMQRLHIKA